MSSADQTIELRSSVIVRCLGWTAFALVLASLGGQVAKFFFGHDLVFGLVFLFNVDEEQNIPTFFSTLQLLVAAALLALIATLSARRSRSDCVPWAAMSIGFATMAYDEICQLHEELSAPMEALLGGRDVGALTLVQWVIPASVVVLTLALLFQRFLNTLPATSRFEFLLSAAIYLCGSFGFELLGADYVKTHAMDFTYNLFATIEEGLEMAGVIVFIRALLNYLARHHTEVTLNFSTISRQNRDGRVSEFAP